MSSRLSRLIIRQQPQPHTNQAKSTQTKQTNPEQTSKPKKTKETNPDQTSKFQENQRNQQTEKKHTPTHHEKAKKTIKPNKKTTATYRQPTARGALRFERECLGSLGARAAGIGVELLGFANFGWFFGPFWALLFGTFWYLLGIF